MVPPWPPWSTARAHIDPGQTHFDPFSLGPGLVSRLSAGGPPSPRNLRDLTKLTVPSSFHPSLELIPDRFCCCSAHALFSTQLPSNRESRTLYYIPSEQPQRFTVIEYGQLLHRSSPSTLSIGTNINNPPLALSIIHFLLDTCFVWGKRGGP